LRYASTVFSIELLNELLQLKDIRVIGANQISDFDIVLYLSGEGLPPQCKNDPDDDFNPINIRIDLSDLSVV
jgi:hypothetical protein